MHFLKIKLYIYCTQNQCMKKLITLTTLTVLFSCVPKKEQRVYSLITKANWFIGEWHNTSKFGNFTEKWEKLSDSTMTGESFIIKGSDTVFRENILLEQRNDSLFYNVILVSEQKQEESTSFYLTKSSEKELVFENPSHNFPNKIVYNLIKSDSILASIHGKNKGIEKSELFPMTKKK